LLLGAGCSSGSGSGNAAGSGGSGNAAGSGGSGGATGTELCDNGVDDDQNGYKDCEDTACFDDAGCIAKELPSSPTYAACGKPVTFPDADSIQVCQLYDSTAFPTFSTKCGFAKFTGTITFYCPPAPASGQKDSVVVRWKANAYLPFEMVNGKPVSWDSYGGEFQFLNGGGSSINPLHYTFDLVGNDTSADFIGYEPLEMPPGSNGGTLYEWFTLDSFGTPAGTYIGGGFSVDIDMAALRSGT